MRVGGAAGLGALVLTTAQPASSHTRMNALRSCRADGNLDTQHSEQNGSASIISGMFVCGLILRSRLPELRYH
jgi:hypothetical protein